MEKRGRRKVIVSTSKGVMTSMRQERKDWEERFSSLFGNMSKIAKKPVILKEGVNV